MSRKLFLVLCVLLAGGALLTMFVSSGEGSTEAPDPGATEKSSFQQPEALGVDPGAENLADGVRQQVGEPATLTSDLMEDPAIVHAMTGFVGRLVTADGAPIPDASLKLFRGALDSFIDVKTDQFNDSMPRISILGGESRSDAEGKFRFEGVWPDGFYALRAHVDSDNHHGMAWELVDRVPDPGKTVDLGDVILDRTGVLVGRIVDEAGKGLPGVRVRAADVPGQVVGLVPLEWIDPTGGVIVRENLGPRALMFPAIVERRFEDLPIAQGMTDAEGHYRLVGLTVGSNLFTATLRGLRPEALPSVRVKANEITELNDVTLREGEEIFGRVVDENGEPMAGVEVLAGPTSLAIPLDFAIPLGVTNAAGEFTSLGFPPGRVTAAARRGPGQPWVRSEPISVEQDIKIVLATGRSLTIRIEPKSETLDVGQAKVQLSAGRMMGAAEKVMFGLVDPLPVAAASSDPVLGAVQLEDDGSYKAAGLEPGRYTVVVRVPGAADMAAEVDLRKEDQEVTLTPDLARIVALQVLDPDGAGLRNARVMYRSRRVRSGAKGRYLRSVRDVPTDAGLTDAEGMLRLELSQDATAQVSVNHPAFGTVLGKIAIEAKDAVLQMQLPGAIEGVMTRQGQPPAATEKFSIACFARELDGGMGATPRFGSPDKDGHFSFGGLQPGRYRLQVLPPVRKLLSGTEITKAIGEVMMITELPRKSIEVIPGGVASVTLELEPGVDGPVAFLRGTVRVNGALSAGLTVRWWPPTGRQRRMVTEKNGTFDFGQVVAGSGVISVDLKRTDEVFERGQRVFREAINLEAGSVTDRSIDADVGQLEVTVRDNAGLPMPKAFVRLGAGEKTTDEDGRCTFPTVPVGEFSIRATGSEDLLMGRAVGIALRGTTVRLEVVLQPTYTLSGRLDCSAIGQEGPLRGYLSVRLDGRRIAGTSIQGDGTFAISGVPAGRITFHPSIRNGGNEPLVSFAVVKSSSVEIVDPNLEVRSDVQGLVLIVREQKDDGK